MTNDVIIPHVWRPEEQLARAVTVAENWVAKGREDIAARHLIGVVQRVLPLMNKGTGSGTD